VTGALAGVQRAAVRAALVPVVLVGELLVVHPADQGAAFAILIGAFAAWSVALLAVHLGAHAGRVRVPPALEGIEPFVDLAAIVALTYSSGGPFSEVGTAFFVLPLIAAASLRPTAAAGWCAAAIGAYALLSILHGSAGDPQGTARMISQLGYLACGGLAATLLSSVLARRSAAIAALAQERGELAAQALAAEQQERSRLAELLHDESVQTLALAQQELGDYHRTGRESAFERARAAIAEAMAQLRGEIFELHPYLLDHAGLGATLSAIAERFAGRTGAEIAVAVDPAAAGLHDELVVVLVRELLANAARHSGADKVVVTVAAQSERIEVEVRDDGAGFDGGRRTEALAAGHIGLASCERRVQAIGGELAVASAAGRGTTVRVTLPGVPARTAAPRPRRRRSRRRSSPRRPFGERSRGAR
jgi:two-component system, NarL family, sensor kinase